MKKLTQKEKIKILESAIRCPRIEYLAWEEGILLHRNGDSCFIVDEQRCGKVEAALEKNEIVLFTENDKPISYVKDGEEHRW